MPNRALWNVRCGAHRSNGQSCGAWSIRGGYVCRVHGGATRQARRLAAYRLWRAGIWARIGDDAARRLGALDQRRQADPVALQAEVITWMRQSRYRLAKFKAVNGRQPRGAEVDLII